MAYNYEWPYVGTDKWNADWLLSKMQEIIIEWAKMQSGWIDLNKQFNDLKTYVENYFTNLDVQEEINEKLDAMAADGSLGDIIARYVPPYEVNLNKYLSRGMAFTEALNQAVSDCPMYGSIFIPNGNYTYQGTLVINKALTLRGDFWGADQTTTPVFISFNATPGIQVKSVGVRLQDLNLTTSVTDFNIIVEFNEPARYCQMVNVFIKGNVKTHAVRAASSLECLFQDVRIDICNIGFEWLEGTHNNDLFLHCWVRNYYNFGWFMSNYYYGSLINCNADSADAQNNTAYYFINSGSSRMLCCACEGTGVSAVRISNSAEFTVEIFTVRNQHTEPGYGAIDLRVAKKITVMNSASEDDDNLVTPVTADRDSSFICQNCNFTRVNFAGTMYFIRGCLDSFGLVPVTTVDGFTITGGTLNRVKALELGGRIILEMDVSFTSFSTFITPPASIGLYSVIYGFASDGGVVSNTGTQIQITNPTSSGAHMVYVIM